MSKVITLNEGAQRDFVNNPHRASGYIGGLGSGKTFAGIARGLKFSQQPMAEGTIYGPRGVCGAVSYPVLKDVVLPQFIEMMEGSGLWKTGAMDTSYFKAEKKAHLKANCGCRNRTMCPHIAEILFRSLDNPDVIRGVELSWFFIDEGRHLSRYAWDVAYGRLRQKGYFHSGWVCSTPNGYDWMYDLLHPDSPKKHPDAEWYGASTHANQEHLPEEYIRSLEATYEGKFYEQEVLGRFVGIVHGAVFPHWDSGKFLRPQEYDPHLPLYTGWDFGVGDPGVCLFAQVEYVEKRLPSGGTESVPKLRFHSYIEATDWSAADWADAYKTHCDEHFEGRRPERNFGDPAGRQRNAVTGTSVMDALAAHGVHVAPAPKKPRDFSILLLDNMMAGARVEADADRCARLGAALATHRWPVDDAGNRTGSNPVHDWTSHFADAARYLAASVLSHFPRRGAAPVAQPPQPGTMGHIIEQLLAPKNTGQWLGQPAARPIEWTPVVGGR